MWIRSSGVRRSGVVRRSTKLFGFGEEFGENETVEGMAPEFFKRFIFEHFFHVEGNFEFFHLFADVNEFFEIIDGLDGTGEHFVEAFLEGESGAFIKIGAVGVIVTFGVKLLLGSAKAELILTDFSNGCVMRFMKAADSGDAHLKAEAVRGFGGDEDADFGVGVFSQPFDQLLLLSWRNFLGEGVWVWFCHRSLMVNYFRR